MGVPATRNGRTWYWWALGICGTIIAVGAIGTFGFSVSTAGAQTKHNIDTEAHPKIVGQLNMIKADVGTNKGLIEKNAGTLGAVRDEQIRQGMMLDQIKKAVDKSP